MLSQLDYFRIHTSHLATQELRGKRMASSKANAKLRLLLRANSSKENFQKDTIDEKAIHRNRSVKLKQTLFVVHFENRKKAFQQEQQSTDQTNSFHYEHIFQ